MGLNERTMAEILGRDIFTDKGAYCGKIADVEFDLQKFRIRAVIVDAAKGSFLANFLGGNRGVIVPYHMIKAVGDIAIIQHISKSVAEEASAVPDM